MMQSITVLTNPTKLRTKINKQIKTKTIMITYKWIFKAFDCKVSEV